MPAGQIQNAGCVFVNCPFDDGYKGLFDTIVFTVFDCGFTPRCAKEVADSGEVRIDKIQRIIEECKFGIHDISRVELNKNGLPRFNMPLELGLFLGAKKYGAGLQKEKVCLILDTEEYRYQEFISDIAGQDIEAHNNDVETCIKIVRKWLNEASGRKTLPGYKAIYRRYKLFRKELPAICEELEVGLDEVSFNDFAQFTSEWLKNQ
ncbi:MAG TPA: hypothetical protein VJ952_08295 [Opitutales bacterium]|nr:hypothetical protein [Opitutales bacterium]